MKLTGIHIYYYAVCKRKLWYFANAIRMEHVDENVVLGKLLDQTSYQNVSKKIMIDETVHIDFIRDWKILHEVKKSKAMEEASILQLKYYIYYLQNKGIAIEKGILDYPKLRERKEIFLTKQDRDHFTEICKEIVAILQRDKAPIMQEKCICKKCAYYEYCFI